MYNAAHRKENLKTNDNFDDKRRTIEDQKRFRNEFATEAVKGALPVGRNSPQRAPLAMPNSFQTAFLPRLVKRSFFIVLSIETEKFIGEI